MENKLTNAKNQVTTNLSRFPVLAIALSGNLDERLLIKLSKIEERLGVYQRF